MIARDAGTIRQLAVLAICGLAICARFDAAVAQPRRAPTGPGVGQGMILQISIFRPNPRPERPTAPVNNLQELMGAIKGCWSPPPADDNRQPLDLNFTISFKRSGELFGKPRAVIFARPVSDEERQLYYTAVAEAVDRCSQMPFTDTMGGAVAGRTFQIRFIDMRNRKQV